jgi:RimJ/RimL family protein N-acetyltransferase
MDNRLIYLQKEIMQSEYRNFFSDGFMLETARVILRPMTWEDFDALEPLTHDADIWTWFKQDLSQPGELKTWMEEAFAGRASETRMPLVILDQDTKQICGCTSFGNISFEEKRVEIGWTWLGKEFIGTGINRQAKFALLSYAFETMKVERVEIKTDAANERSKAAILKIGLIPEGILRSHMQMHSNRRRDTMYFGLLRDEWTERKQSFFSDMVY